MLLTEQISFSYFCRESPSDHFWQKKKFNSDHWLQMIRFLKFSHRYVIETSLAPGGRVFDGSNSFKTIFIEGQPVTISTIVF